MRNGCDPRKRNEVYERELVTKKKLRIKMSRKAK